METGQTRILIDTTPDLRTQLLDSRISSIDAVIWTHDHADHVHGLDDLRQLYHMRGAPIPGYARPHTAEVLRQRFGYVFAGADGYPATATLEELRSDGRIGDIAVRVVDQPHGTITSAGLRFEANGHAIAYATDFNRMTDEMRELYKGLDIWIVDALRRRPHPTHAHLDMTLDWIAELGPRRAVLTHMDNSMDYRSLLNELPSGVEPGHDMMEMMLS